MPSSRTSSMSPDNRIPPLNEVRSVTPAPLPKRQQECLGWIQQGKSANDIGVILGISGRTVEGHIQKLRRYFDVPTKIQVVVRARELGLLGPDT